MLRRSAAVVTPYLGILAAAAGAALLAADVAIARSAGAPLVRVAADLALFIGGLLAHRVARAGRKEAPALALTLLVVASAPALLATGRWWLGPAAAAVIATAAPHAIPRERATAWIVASVLLALTAWPDGLETALAAAGFVALVGAGSTGLARDLAEARRRTQRTAATRMEDEHRRVADLVERVQAYEGPDEQRSFLKLALSRRLGMMTAMARSIQRELGDSLDAQHAPGPEGIRGAAQRAIARASRITQLASGNQQDGAGTTLRLLWPRVRSYLGTTLLPTHHLESTIAPDLPPLRGTAEEWLQIITLLVEDALGAMRGGGIVRLSAARGPDGFVTIMVADSRTVTETAPGENLELAEALVLGLGGRFCREPGDPDGLTVRIETPVHRAAAARPASADLSFTGQVLVADDDPQVRRATARLLQSMGLETTEADNGTVALARFRADQSRFRTAVLDVVMPGTPVGDVVAAIREVRPDFPVILLSGYDVDRYLDSIVALGRVRFLRKPATREDLGATLRDLLPVSTPAPTGA